MYDAQLRVRRTGLGDIAMLNGACVLVAEDQALIALELAFAIEDAGGEVAGPVASVKAALALIKVRPVSAAIVDFNLVDGDVVPVLAALSDARIPVIMQSGVGPPPHLMVRFPELIVFIKPSDTGELIHELCRLIGRAQ